MRTSRRIRLSVLAAALSGALVVAMAGTALAADLDCSDFEFREDAQSVLDADRSDPNRLDGGSDGPADGVACESLPSRGSADDRSDDRAADVASDSGDDDSLATTPATDPDDDSDEGSDRDRDCADFTSQAAAQAALTARTDDPEELDSDDDGIACEQHFGTDGRQVAVYPNGGVATGGAARP
jgi:hypothetical protein